MDLSRDNDPVAALAKRIDKIERLLRPGGQKRIDPAVLDKGKLSKLVSSFETDTESIGRGVVTGTNMAADAMPWLIQVLPQHPDYAENVGPWVPNYGAAGEAFGGNGSSAGAQFNRVAWDLLFSAGTYSLSLVYKKLANGGIMTFQLDDETLSTTVDTYLAVTLPNQFVTIPGVQVPVNGKKRFRIRMDSKNAASGGYFGIINSFQFWRTA